MVHNQTFEERLNHVHDFPTLFTVKVIGLNNPEFITRVEDASRSSLGTEIPVEVALKTSSGAKHVSVGITFDAPNAITIVRLYDVLKALDGVTYLI